MRLEGLEPFIPAKPRGLILGSMPSAASLAEGFYYAHPRNRFWKLIKRAVPFEIENLDDKKKALGYLNLALYDSIKSCEREGSSLDSKIKNAVPADIGALVREHPSIEFILTNGALSKKLFLKHNQIEGIELIHLPSTSPANAAWPLERLWELYGPWLLKAAGARD